MFRFSWLLPYLPVPVPKVFLSRHPGFLQVIKKVRVEQKLVLFYLVNDIVQHSAKKGFTELLDKFRSGIKESMPHLKEEKIAYKVPVLIHTLMFINL